MCIFIYTPKASFVLLFTHTKKHAIITTILIKIPNNYDKSRFKYNSLLMLTNFKPDGHFFIFPGPSPICWAVQTAEIPDLTSGIFLSVRKTATLPRVTVAEPYRRKFTFLLCRHKKTEENRYKNGRQIVHNLQFSHT